jgi:hypothetical protein
MLRPNPAQAVSEVPTPGSESGNREGDLLERQAPGPATSRELPIIPAEAEAKTAALIGCWVSRADDGSVCTFDLRENEHAVFTGAFIDPRQGVPLVGRWAVTSVDGPDVTVDIIYAASGFEVHRIKLEMPGVDCLLVRQTSFKGRVQDLNQRFVRRTSPAP